MPVCTIARTCPTESVSTPALAAHKRDRRNSSSLCRTSSPTLLAPTPRSLFGAKKADLVFDAGTLTGYGVDFEGDGIQLVSLPVKVLGAVSGAAGEVFTFRRNRAAQSETAAISAELALQAQRVARDECRAAR